MTLVHKMRTYVQGKTCCLVEGAAVLGAQFVGFPVSLRVKKWKSSIDRVCYFLEPIISFYSADDIYGL